MPRRAVRILVLVWFGAMVATAPAGVGAADGDRILRVGTTEEFDSINPHLSFVGSSAEATNLDYDVLVGLGPELEYAPTGFAESWSQDRTAWTFIIRDGMRWSDGRVADANDVAFTFRYILASMDPAYIGPWAPEGNDLPRAGSTRGDRRPDNPLSLYGDVLVDAVGLRSVELVDDRTVRLTTVEPTTLLLGALVPILPAHVWSTVPFARAATDFQSAPPVVGSGPFQVVEWQRGTSARFVLNPHYWGKRPYVEEVEFRFYPDQAAMTAALRRGEIDYARDIAAADVEPLDEDAAIVAIQGLASGYTHLAFNVYGKDIDGGGASTAAVRDPSFRDALGYALDHDEITDAAVDGHATPGSTAIPPAVVQFHIDPTRPRRYDPAEARELLDVAGYRDGDGDGVREDLDGRPIELRLFYPTSDRKYAASAVAVAADWERVGIGVTAKGLDPEALAEQLYVPEAGGTAEYDVELWGWTGSPDPDFLLSLLTTAEIGGWSDSNYSNPAYDRLFEAQRRAASIDQRRSIVGQMQDIAYDDAPYHVLFYDDDLHARRTDRFEGWTTQPRDGGVSLFTSGVQAYLDLAPVGTSGTPGPAIVSPGPGSTAVPSPSPSQAAGSLMRYSPGTVTLALAGTLAAIGGLILTMVGHRMRGRRGS